MSRYLLDTNILSYAIRRTHEGLLQRLEQALLADSATISIFNYATCSTLSGLKASR